jgi:REP element-mobilizing transposase RayT
MPRRNLEFVPGEIYHLYNRGAGKSPIFDAPDDYYFFTAKVWSYSRALKIPILACCLMPNHYHLVVMQAADTSAGQLPQRVCNSYSKRFNRRNDRTGTLFQGRYRAKHIPTQDYLEQVCVYVHLNPVLAGLVSEPEHWPYSDYDRWIGSGAVLDSMNVHLELGLKLGADYRQALAEILLDKRELRP